MNNDLWIFGNEAWLFYFYFNWNQTIIAIMNDTLGGRTGVDCSFLVDVASSNTSLIESIYCKKWCGITRWIDTSMTASETYTQKSVMTEKRKKQTRLKDWKKTTHISTSERQREDREIERKESLNHVSPRLMTGFDQVKDFISTWTSSYFFSSSDIEMINVLPLLSLSSS